MRIPTKQQTSHGLLSCLTAYAFGASYFHGVDFAQKHGDDAAAWGVAAIPEVILISVLLRGRKDLKGFVGAVIAFAMTISVNVAAAEPGLAGLVVALVAPVASILCAWFTHDKPEKAPEATLVDVPKSGVVADGIAWLKAQEGSLTIAQIAEARGCSKTSAGKIRKAVYA
jgi:hypothetical protein